MNYKQLSEEDFLQGYSPDNIFITSDLHLFHTNIIVYCNRPFEYSAMGCSQMNEFILKKFDTLPDDCFIWNFGDVYLNIHLEHSKIMNDIMRMKKNRKMCLILGNHDFSNDKKPFKNYIDFYTYLGFDKVYKGPLQFKNYLLSHEPVYFDSSCGLVNIHGHTHQYFVTQDYFISNFNKKYPKKKVDPSCYKNVCLDANNFELLKLSDVMEF
jgi:calcineurin-like phosphoesterase family protein